MSSSISRREFALGGLLTLPVALKACLPELQEISEDQAKIAVLERSMYEAERLLYYLAMREDLPLDAWREVFDRAVKRVQAGWNVWDKNLWKSDKLIDQERERS